jgi:hypothetical protein
MTVSKADEPHHSYTFQILPVPYTEVRLCRTTRAECQATSIGQLLQMRVAASSVRLYWSENSPSQTSRFSQQGQALKRRRKASNQPQEALTATAAARNRGHPQPAQKLVFCNSNLDISTTVCKMGDLEVFPKAFLEHLTGVYLIGVSHGRVPHGPPCISYLRGQGG